MRLGRSRKNPVQGCTRLNSKSSTILFPSEAVPTDAKHTSALRLTFGADLEREFGLHATDKRLHKIRITLCLAMLLALGFGMLDAGNANSVSGGFWVNGSVLLIMVLLGAALAVTHLRAGWVLYCKVAEVLAISLGLTAAAGELFGVASFGPMALTRIMLVVLYSYHLLGLRFFQAIRVNAVLFVACGVIGGFAGMPFPALGAMLFALALVNAVGATLCFSFEHEQRAAFLERRMLSATASRDGLTALNNRRRFDEHLNTVWPLAQRDGVPLALLLVDIDSFKAYNDWYGHQAGDDCLQKVAAALRDAARRPLDFTARYGGEEFAVILYNASRSYVSETAAQIHKNIADLGLPHSNSAVGDRVTVSIGIAHVVPSLHRSAQGFVQLADQSLYQAKEEGRDRSVSNNTAYDSLKTGIFRINRRA
jgi:diguanylate cyclase (GGDEF)-like protein